MVEIQSRGWISKEIIGDAQMEIFMDLHPPPICGGEAPTSLSRDNKTTFVSLENPKKVTISTFFPSRESEMIGFTVL
ncbi:hypothetical protein LWI29_029423 [Acer saccharum]|uniref:Uncharacterized protein n=1 Tax=Acer saccharum TaxID=4024 RepID=A0AA39UL58_ACESA|nr:hypothetical protein LWI29_029423 [Acer saccharum]